MDNLGKKEIEIIKQAQNGSVKAFNKLFYMYKDYIEKILVSYIKDKDEASDLANIVFIRIYQNIDKFNRYDNFKGWITILAKRIAIDYIRSINSKVVSIDDTEKNIQLTSKELDNISNSDVMDVYNDAISIINTLPELHSKVCRMFYIYNLTITQISKKLNVPIGTIKSYSHRARKLIKNKLKLC